MYIICVFLKGFPQKDKIYQPDVFSWCIQGRVKLLHVIVTKSHNTCTNHLSPSCCRGSSKQNTKKESYDLCSLVLHSVFDTMLICVSLTNCNLS